MIGKGFIIELNTQTPNFLVLKNQSIINNKHLKCTVHVYNDNFLKFFIHMSFLQLLVLSINSYKTAYDYYKRQIKVWSVC